MRVNSFLSAIALALSLTLAGPSAAAAPELSPEALSAFLGGLPSADQARGKELHQGRGCASCHGAEGIAGGAYPSLAGLPFHYTAKTMMDYRAGHRGAGVPGAGAMMAMIAKQIEDQQLADLSAYYAGLPAKAATLGPRPPILHVKGDPSRFITPCASCHGADGRGGVSGQVPYLTGASPAYLFDSLHSFRVGRRSSDLLKEMRAFTGKLTDREIEELSEYFGGEPVPDQAKAQWQPKP